MKKVLFKLLLFIFFINGASKSHAQTKLDSLLPVRGFAIGVPSPTLVDSFINFIRNELAPRKINTLLLRIDYNYNYKSHPELVGGSTLSEAEVKKIVAVCKQNNVRIIPQINLLGHQSWASQ